MKDRKNRLYHAAAAGLIGYAAAWFLLAFVLPPLPWYDPVLRSWTLSAGSPGGLAMGWFGKVLYAAVAGLAGGAVGWFLPIAGAAPEAGRAADTHESRIGYVAVAAMAIAMVVFTARLVARITSGPPH